MQKLKISKRTLYLGWLSIVLTLGAILFIFLNNIFAEKSVFESGPTLKINNTIIPVEVVDTEDTRRLGLSYRESLDVSAGMLFVMADRRVSGFWMKDMNFPLDIVWIDKDTIVNISQDLPPGGTSPDQSYSSVYPVDLVLELNGGFSDRNNIKIGDKIIFNLQKNDIK